VVENKIVIPYPSHPPLCRGGVLTLVALDKSLGLIHNVAT